MVNPLHLIASVAGVVKRRAPARWSGPPRSGLIGPIELPAHDALLPTEAVQWWYWTGHLEGRARDGARPGETRQFGFELVFFVFNTFKVVRTQLGQAAITDRAGQRFLYDESLVLGLPPEESGKFTLVGEGQKLRARGGGGRDWLAARLGDDGKAGFDLRVVSRSPAALHYGGYPHPLRGGGFTYYYSRPDMATEGTLVLDGVTYDVAGSAWFDRQYGDLFQLIAGGWQWFALHFNDGRRVMIFDFPPGPEQVENLAAIMGPDGSYRVLPGERFRVQVLDTWESAGTHTRYPARWRIELDDLCCEAVPWVPDQELRPSAKTRLWIGPEYWEGACELLRPGTSEVIGQAYVELNGYADSGVIARTLAALSDLLD